ncbi:hypothetical protein [Nocardia sp. NPDC058497]|uniref:hypothetical protein n=1 Tax=Nocardia sp. NPDC058497 TaxID=3346529 RepID=UPI00366511FD
MRSRSGASESSSAATSSWVMARLSVRVQQRDIGVGAEIAHEPIQRRPVASAGVVDGDRVQKHLHPIRQPHPGHDYRQRPYRAHLDPLPRYSR